MPRCSCFRRGSADPVRAILFRQDERGCEPAVHSSRVRCGPMTADADARADGATPATQGELSAAGRAAAPRTLLDILRETTLRHPEASALDDGRGALSYRELMA